MKKALCLSTAIMMLLCACGSALAETGYLAIKETFTGLFGTEPFANDTENINPLPMKVCVEIDIASNIIAISGENEKDEQVYSAWVADKATLYAVFNVLCTMYDDLLTLLDEGWSLTLILNVNDTQMLVDSSERAAIWVDTVASLTE